MTNELPKLFKDADPKRYQQVMDQLERLRELNPAYRDDQLLVYMLLQTEARADDSREVTIEGMREADVRINGQPLPFAESMTLRVAVQTFLLALSGKNFREGIGEVLAAGYTHQLRAIQTKLFASQ